MKLPLRSFFALSIVPVVLPAKVTPSALFQDHAVLQRGKPVPVWGTAEPGERITVSFAGQSFSTAADADGRWSVTLAPLSANSVPGTLTIAGDNTVILSDIVVGEVWLASGQSNMEWIVKNMHDADLERRTARFPLIREIKVKKVTADRPASAFQGEWRRATPETVETFSAVAYSFAKDIHLALDVPVGIVNSSWGGTPIESWISASVLGSDPAFAAVQERYTRLIAEYPAKKAAYDAELAAWNEAKVAATARGEPFTRVSPRPPAGPNSPNNPSVLHNAMIHPLLPFALRGAIWYQGESNASRAAEYEALFTAMIRGWRTDFAQGDFPFFWVQLAAYKASRPDATEWAFLREAQAKALALPATGQALAMDAPVSDFGDIHPRDKAPVGRRLARLALARAYGEKDFADSGPVFSELEPVASNLAPAGLSAQSGDTSSQATPPPPAALRVTFSSVNGRLRHPAPVLTGFEIAGEDRVFQPAEARIDKNTVIVRSAAVPAPVAVRYAWRNHPVAWLQDDLGLPAAPFRSDTW